MLLGSPPDMVHRAPAHGAHIRMQNSAIYSPVRFKYYTIPFGKLQVAVGGLGQKVFVKGNTAQFPPDGLSTAPAAAARHLRCQNAR